METSLAVQWLRLCFHCMGVGSVPGRELGSCMQKGGGGSDQHVTSGTGEEWLYSALW